jgi:SWI/SNF-related matrix-associated actin-dependent regulator of chromatin subfamily A-like protein 1
VSPAPFSASLARDEAVLRFPYDDGLRMLLRAIPGRRWDPVERAWCLPLEPEQAQALALLLEGLPHEPEVSVELERAIARRRARRDRRELLLDVTRPDSDWWLSFATDAAPEPVTALLEHSEAREVPEIGRALVPIDDEATELIDGLRARGAGIRLSDLAHRALSTHAEQRRQGPAGAPAEPSENGAYSRHDIEFRRDRRGEHWILIAGRHAATARVLAASAGLRAAEGPAGSVGLAAIEDDAERLIELLDHLEDADVDPRVTAWLKRASTWRGNIEVEGAEEEPVFVLLGDFKRLPRPLREHAATVPGGASVPLTLESWRMIDGQLDGWMSRAAKRCVEALEQGRPAPPAVLERSRVHDAPAFVLAPGHDESCTHAFAALRGVLPPQRRRGVDHEHASLSAIRADPFCVPALDGLLAEREVWIDPEALALLQDIREQHARGAGLVALSSAADAELDVPGLGGELKPFQRAGVSYLLSQRRAFLADEQGLGKTIEALATLEAANAYPAVIVCPASLKLNWLRELRHWLPERTARALTGGGAGEPEPAADITLINYDILAARLDQLRALSPQALVLDESHYCKNAAAKRTQAVQRLAAEIPREGFVLALTGTPVINRPAELISQLRILGRLEDFGSGVKFGERFRGADAHLRLHWHLRARCFVRRLKADVLQQLPAKTRAIVPVELDNESEYRLAERDLVAWLRSQPLDLGELDAKVAAALRAERLVRLNALKLLAARGKLHAALRWIHDFCSSDERLVVFAHHREIQRALLEHFPRALHILGKDSHASRDKALQRFQAPDDGAENQLIICSIEVAGQGLTLTRSSNVVFLELDWTPAKHDQAEDRCHRIGQQDAVNAYYLLAADTVDETISTLLERKRAVIGAVTDGREEDEEGLVDSLVRELRGTPYKHLRAVA